jgi:mRNA interferase RelE/StbE
LPSFRLLYHPRVLTKDIPRLDQKTRKRIRSAIENKLSNHPESFAKPLAHTTQRLWSLRVGDWRVIFALRQREVWVLKIGHRRDVYDLRPYPEPPDESSVSDPSADDSG